MASTILAAAAAAVTLTVNTTTLTGRAWVRVTYSGLPVPNESFFGIFYPGDCDVSPVDALPYPAEAPFIATAASSWIDCSAMPGCLATGAGFYDFEMTNSFMTASIKVFGGGESKPQLLASSPIMTFTDATMPTRGHLARVADPTEMLVVWHSAFDDADAMVVWGPTAGGPYSFNASSEAATYEREDLCGYPTSVATSVGWSSPFFWHSARVTGLVPGSRDVVYYRYGSATHGWSDELSFIAPPPVGPNVAINVLAIADMGMTPYDGTQNHWQEPMAGNTTQHMIDFAQSGSGYDYSLALHAGDIVYSTGYALKWNLFNDRLTGLADRVPYLLGNHERDWPGSGGFESADSGGECGIPTQTRFPSPTQSSHMQDEGYWSIKHGPATFIMMNTEFACGPGSDQYTFFEDTLKAVDRSVTPWVVFLGHRPMYYVDDSKAGGARDPMFGAFEPLMLQYKVDLMLWGHVHNAYASCPMYNNTCITAPAPGAYDAPVHASIGNAGQGISPINPTNFPSWVRWQMAEWGYSALHIPNATTLMLDLFDDTTGSLQHQIVIQRTFPRT